MSSFVDNEKNMRRGLLDKEARCIVHILFRLCITIFLALGSFVFHKTEARNPHEEYWEVETIPFEKGYASLILTIPLSLRLDIFS